MPVTINGSTGIETPDIAVNSDAFGYATGSGGTVTQLTSKSTSVALDKPTGRIITNNAALAAGATATFTFNNSLLAASDLLVLNPVNNGVVDPSNYRIEISAILNNNAAIRVTNISAGSRSEAIAIGFAIIKGAIS